jgi:predicted DNA-binding transcriptional regulator AlpA
MTKLKLIPTSGVLEKVGISRITLNTWLNDPHNNFPRPILPSAPAGNKQARRYWLESELDKWIVEAHERAQQKESPTQGRA